MTVYLFLYKNIGVEYVRILIFKNQLYFVYVNTFSNIIGFKKLIFIHVC